MSKKPKFKSLAKAEWRHLFKNKMLLISCIVILFVPIMYGGFFLGSIWDPYGSTGDLPVVVVNEDEGAVLQGEQINLGDNLVDELKNDSNLDWQFKSAADAEKGMSDNTYYMSVTLPSDFSENAATVTEKTPKQSVIKYKVAASKNYIGTVISDAAVAQLKSKVSEKLSEAYVKAIFAEIGTLTEGMQAAADGASQINSGVNTANSGSKTLASGLMTYTAGVSALAPGQSQLNTGISLLKQGSLQLEFGLTALSAGLPSSSDVTAIKTGLGQVQVGLSQLNTVVSGMGSNAILANDFNIIGSNLTNIGNLTTQNGTDLSSLSALINSSSASGADKTAMLALVGQISGRLTTTGSDAQAAGLALDDGALSNDDVTGQMSAMETQITELQTSVGQLNSGMNTANAGAQLSLSGFETIRTNLSQLIAGSHSLSTNLNVAFGGSNQLINGVNALNAGSPALLTGANKLSSGLGLLSDGSSELYEKLSDASSQLSMQNVSDAVAAHISSPVMTEKSAQGNVANYGHALAPYVLSLGLFVGALVFNFIYPIRKIFGEITSGVRWWFAKFSVGFAAAILQATVLDLIMIWVLGLQPENMMQFFMTTYATSCAYMAIVMFLSMAFNNPGRFLAMVLLVLQLGGSGGTFPLQLSNDFFQAINPFLPMTYSILGLRESISSGLGSGVYWSSFWILTVVSVAFSLILMTMLSLRHKHGFAPDED